MMLRQDRVQGTTFSAIPKLLGERNEKQPSVVVILELELGCTTFADRIVSQTELVGQLPESRWGD